MVIKKNITKILVGLILISGAFLRLYRLSETATFQGDQGRDAIIVQRIFTERDVPLIGPVTSVGNMYLGPLYYYYMAPWLWLTFPDPIGPVYGVAMVSVLGLWLTYRFGKEMFGQTVGIIAVFLTALMPTAIEASRFSWNPNPQPVVALILYWSLFRMLKRDQPAYLLLATGTFAVLIQLHYIAALLGGLIALTWLYQMIFRPKLRRKLVGYGWVSLMILLVTWSSLLVFDLTHKHIIINGFLNFFTGSERHLEPLTRLNLVIQEMDGRAVKIISQMFGYTHWWGSRIATYIGLLIFIILVLTKKIRVRDNPAVGLLIIGLGLIIFGTAFYNGSVFNHYLLFALPLVVYVWSLILVTLMDINLWGKMVGGGLIGLYAVYAISRAPTFAPAGPTMSYYQRVVNSILPQIKTGRYNLALLSESNDFQGMNYRYFFEVSPHHPEPADDYTNLDQLMVIDEIGVRDPLEINIFEIQAPRLTTLANVFTLSHGPTIYSYTRLSP